MDKIIKGMIRLMWAIMPADAAAAAAGSHSSHSSCRHLGASTTVSAGLLTRRSAAQEQLNRGNPAS
jgi:hypothetical protein